MVHSQELVRECEEKYGPIKAPGEAEVNFALNVIIINIIMGTLGCSELFASHRSTFITPCPVIAWCHVLYCCLRKYRFPEPQPKEAVLG